MAIFDLASSGSMALRNHRRRATQLALGAAALATVTARLRERIVRFEVVEDSMQPALQPGDYLVSVLPTTVARGDVVIYPDPAAPGRALVKRVVALGGESIAISGGRVMIDGAALAEPWADGPTRPDGEWQIPAGAFFPLGDNRRISAGDGRSSGPVPLTGIYKAVLRYWPPGSCGRL